jgi:hypothetical protein
MKSVVCAALLSFAVLTACTNNPLNLNVETYLTLEGNDITATTEGGSYDVFVTSNVAWSVTSNVSWIEIESNAEEGDGKIVVTVTGNDKPISRKAQIAVGGAGVESASISITQAAAAPIMDVDTYIVNASEAGGEFALHISSNVAWHIDTGGVEWLTLSKSKGEGDAEIAITIVPNKLYIERSSMLTLKGESVADVAIEVTQSHADFVQPASGTLAYSNIILEGDHLTFATSVEESNVYLPQQQGLFFKWGSLIGVSPNGDFDASKIAFVPQGFAGTITSDIESVPYIDKDNNVSDKDYDQFIDDYPYSGYDAEAGKGDICRYISAQGWVPGKWCTPTISAYERLVADNEVVGNFAATVSDKSDGTFLIESGYNFGSGDNVRFMPASGYIWQQIESQVGIGGYYFSASPSSAVHVKAMTLDKRQVRTHGNFQRKNCLPVRCIAE